MTNTLNNVIWIFMSWQLSECNNFTPIIPDQCKNQNICEDVPNYPYEYMDGVIKGIEEHGYIWQSNEESVTLSKLDEGQRNIVDICPSEVKNTIPLAARDGTGQWHFVINQKRRIIQSFRVEVCQKQVVGKRCGEGLQGIEVKAYGGYSILCKQEFLGRVVKCLDEVGKIINIVTDVASCCSCAVYRS